MNRYLIAGFGALAGAALFEALVPAAVIGGAALLAPTVLPVLRHRQPRRQRKPPARKQAAPVAPARADRHEAPAAPSIAVGKFAVKQALAKTITFRVIVTALDFTSNYIVLGELATAAGLSTFALVAGPVFYFAHETMWNYLGPPEAAPINVRLRVFRSSEQEEAGVGRRLAISRALAKTVTYRAIATAMDFTTTFIVVGDLATAAGLSAFGFVIGPFVYWGHEAAWDYYGSGDRQNHPPAINNIAAST